MLKIIILFIITLSLHAQSSVPEWIKKDPDKKGKYFRGTSAWYVTNDARMETLSQKDAIHNAYSYVSEYFGVSIKSSFEIKEQVKNNMIKSDSKSSLKTKTNQLILNLKPYKIYKELDESKENFRLHVLILLNRFSENKIRNEMLQDKQEFTHLKQKVLNSIEKKEYFKAKNFLELAKGKRCAFTDESLQKIEKRLKTLIDGLLQAKLSINKKIYQPDEAIELEVSLNQDGYLYLFYETSSDVEMLFPNEYKRVAHIKKQQLISFPNEDIQNITAYEEDLEKDVMFYAVASKDNLSLKGLSSDIVDGIYIFGTNGTYKEIINRCINEDKCVKSVVSFKISNIVSSVPINLKLYSDDIDEKYFFKYFKSKGITSIKSDKEIIFDIEQITKYSQQLDTTIQTYKIVSKLYNKNLLIKTLEDECSKNELYESLFEIYQELAKVSS